MHTKLQEALNALQDVRGQLGAAIRLDTLTAELGNNLERAAAYVHGIERKEEELVQREAGVLRERELLDNRIAELERAELNFSQRNGQLERAEALYERKRSELNAFVEEAKKGEADLTTFGVSFLRVTEQGVKHVPLSEVKKGL